MAQKKTGWHKEDIKAAIRKTGITLTGLSTLHGYEESAVRGALRKSSATVEAIISDRIGVPAQELWPDRYHSNGQHKSLQSRYQRSRKWRRGKHAASV